MGITTHAAERMAERGIADADVQDAIKNPIHTKEVTTDSMGRRSQIIIGKAVTVCINPDTGQTITTWKTGTKTRKKYEGGE